MICCSESSSFRWRSWAQTRARWSVPVQHAELSAEQADFTHLKLKCYNVITAGKYFTHVYSCLVSDSNIPLLCLQSSLNNWRMYTWIRILFYFECNYLSSHVNTFPSKMKWNVQCLISCIWTSHELPVQHFQMSLQAEVCTAYYVFQQDHKETAISLIKAIKFMLFHFKGIFKS